MLTTSKALPAQVSGKLVIVFKAGKATPPNSSRSPSLSCRSFASLRPSSSFSPSLFTSLSSSLSTSLSLSHPSLGETASVASFAPLPSQTHNAKRSPSRLTSKRGLLQLRRSFNGGEPQGEGSNLTLALNLVFIAGSLYLLTVSGLGKVLVYCWLGLWLASNVLPPLIFQGLKMYAQKNLVAAECPTCGAPMEVLRISPTKQCFECGTLSELTEDDKLVRAAPSFEQNQPRSGVNFDQNPFSSAGPATRKSSSADVTIDAEVIDIDPTDTKR